MRDITTNLINDLKYNPDHLDFIVLPGMLHINLATARIQEPVRVGSQNVSQYQDGAYTGEVSAE